MRSIEQRTIVKLTKIAVKVEGLLTAYFREHPLRRFGFRWPQNRGIAGCTPASERDRGMKAKRVLVIYRLNPPRVRERPPIAGRLGQRSKPLPRATEPPGRLLTLDFYDDLRRDAPTATLGHISTMRWDGALYRDRFVQQEAFVKCHGAFVHDHF